ncbi:hypothetical protein KOR34_34580 [Posidoniimonas corsicana]|uniref:CcmD family protein n=1 Tax=Posidoniimonas corsicana TaxID=1938618 RepID=A0A5C5V7B0_9BACT|nr:hypothetical protein [Posidoniimonas corsicana]TWT33625.1 hypothetical protein KOR34_34580 [Posidoniimonas corsicana]
MSYHILQSILGAAFLAVWSFIAVTMLRDKLSEARRKRLSSQPTAPPAPKYSKRRRRRRDRDQAVAGA